MAVACAFDRWQKDVFFPAAEAVQDSADIMQSTYRMWIRKRAEASGSAIVEDLSKDLQTSLGTAKWQLEEFERAVKATHKNCSSEDDSITRHRQFVEAIGDQISKVEKALKDSLIEEGKQPLRWVQLNDEDYSDLAEFLSVSQTELREPGRTNQTKEVDEPASGTRCIEILTADNDSMCVPEVDVKKVNNEACDRGLAEGQRRIWSSPDISDWKIVIQEETSSKGKVLKNKIQEPFHFINLYGLVNNSRVMTKSKWSRRNFQGDNNGARLPRKQSFSSYLDVRMIPRFVQGGGISSQRNPRNFICEGHGKSQTTETNGSEAFSHPLQGLRFFTCFQPFRIIVLLILAAFIIVPFVFYTN